jgi:hypothetical protein
MANILISSLDSNGLSLFSGEENFMSEISESDFAVVYGGMDTPATDWCTTTKTIIITRTPFPFPIPTSPIVVTTRI